MRSAACGFSTRNLLNSSIGNSRHCTAVSAQTSADRRSSSSAISPNSMPWSRLASRTPLGSFTLTMPLCKKNSDDAGSSAATMRCPAA